MIISVKKKVQVSGQGRSEVCLQGKTGPIQSLVYIYRALIDNHNAITLSR